mmetsp:Transcript_54957/g.133474  ORF Transcript_54957/g.133474 Transcript_54957/m.133474 type:complete len:727 (-) Transcript_54957:319-2499(-)
MNNAASATSGDNSGGGGPTKPKPKPVVGQRGKQQPGAVTTLQGQHHHQQQQQHRPPPRSPRSPSKKNKNNGVPNKQNLPRLPSTKPSVSTQAPPTMRSPPVSPNKKKKNTMNNTTPVAGSSPGNNRNKRFPSMPSQHNRPAPPQIYQQQQKPRPTMNRNSSNNNRNNNKNNNKTTNDGIMKMKAPPRPASMIVAPSSPKKAKAGINNNGKKKNKTTTTTTTTSKNKMPKHTPQRKLSQQGRRPDPPPGNNAGSGYGGKGRTMSMPPPPATANPFQDLLVKTKSIVTMGLSSHSSGGSFDMDLSDDEDFYRNNSSRPGKGNGKGVRGGRRNSLQHHQPSHDGIYSNNGWDDDYKEYNGDVDGYYGAYEEYDALKGDGGTASHHTRRSRRPSQLGASSIHTGGPSIAPLPFPDDTRWQKFLRYIKILPPEENELPTHRKIRIFIWCSLVLDFLCAVVALATFGQVTTCCGKPIWGFGTDSFDFSKAMRVVAVLYLVGIFVEVVPVVRGGIPWNMINPLFGFLISFAVFFDDSRVEAISMWVLEALAIFFEFLVYRIRRRLLLQKKAELAEVESKLEPYVMAKRVQKAAEASGSAPPHRGISRGLSRTLSKELSVSSFYSASDAGTEHHGDHREIKLLRQRKRLREERATERTHLHYHLTGVVFNTVLIFITIMVIIFVARSGGMCVLGGEGPNPFATNQLEKCTACQGVSGKCEVCGIDPHQCYYPYG